MLAKLGSLLIPSVCPPLNVNANGPAVNEKSSWDEIPHSWDTLEAGHQLYRTSPTKRCPISERSSADASEGTLEGKFSSDILTPIFCAALISLAL
jgi:hypothetical protein